MIDNPRSILIRGNLLWGFFKQRDLHAIPDIIAKKKAVLSYFYRLWRKEIGSAKLIYTRSQEGRLRLLKARIHALSANLSQDRTGRVSCWR